MAIIEVVLLAANERVPKALDDRAFVYLVAQVARVRLDNRNLLQHQHLAISLVTHFKRGAVRPLAQPRQYFKFLHCPLRLLHLHPATTLRIAALASEITRLRNRALGRRRTLRDKVALQDLVEVLYRHCLLILAIHIQHRFLLLHIIINNDICFKLTLYDYIQFHVIKSQFP